MKLLKIGLTFQMKNSFVLLMLQNSFVLSMWVHALKEKHLFSINVYN